MSLVRLYRQVLAAHRKILPPAQRQLGDAYARSEFRLHKNANDDFLQIFERQWRDYLTQIARNDGSLGRPMSPEEVEALSDEQKVQLLKIHENVRNNPSP
ncbi:hypothetical protein AB1Y20_023687 [Prymnesium parvum]|uniref:Succinate dehydrogenase assembly factor 3 n=1 Tax=Prymnesium parvum TaxID=97485 RepID=A0AB34JGK7_PRYPA|mmetsp:Transcript_30856/g.77059  ORF Transcript_30856/g.77059 Transcript_30856/m.77059 type:complete len:100 (+) Transcript_30856:11-310(+)|eukprot:CAMPEP_0195597182 /NCGR_PEP_ID=MMETSP0815-20121206/2852_1 /TAXON_ID=97485 /ORGANISM="Prymnesium parvum, Strain Texoma1" /LENGTH=99 /DNA_ID=CAMNT_0040736513 /DNA_START=11 /DNA_END=310 /DNA_ORIENTATION=-